MPSPSPNYREDIDGLRALAVAIVILFHFEFSGLPGGFVGVDVFFVISGFLITSLIARQIAEKRFSLIDFYERRFRRIYPNLVIVLVATTALGFAAMVPLTYRPFGRTLTWATLSVSNFAFIGGNGYFDPANLTKPLLHTWSLGVEEQFYLVFPWLPILAAKRDYSAKWLIGGLVALSLALSIGAATLNWSPSYFLLPTRFWELGIGALIAILPTNDNLSAPQRSLLGVAGLAAIAWAALCLSESDPFPGYLALAPTLGAVAIIWANGGLAAKFLSFRPFVWIGRLSFALYLWHWPLISIAAGIGLPPTDTTTRLIISAVMLVLSVIGYFLWEQPIRERRIMPKRKAFFATLAIITILLVVTGILINKTRGLPQRLPADLVAIDDVLKANSFLINQQCPPDPNGEDFECPIGDKAVAKTSFVIIGDSQAHASAFEIGEVAKTHHLRGLYLGRSGCIPLANLTRSQEKNCQEHYHFSLEKIKKYDPQLIFLITIWDAMVGDSKGGPTTPLLYRGKPVSNSERVEATSVALSETMRDLEQRQVVTSLPIPEYSEKAPITWKLWAERIGFPSSITELKISEHRERQVYTKKLLQDFKSKYSNLQVIDPESIFCNEEFCIRENNKSILYLDGIHLSHEGAKLYADLFEPYLSKINDYNADKDQ